MIISTQHSLNISTLLRRAVPALILMLFSGVSLAASGAVSGAVSSAASSASASVDDFSKFLWENIDGIYMIIDTVTTIAVAVTFFWILMNLTDPRDRKLGGVVFGTFLVLAVLPNQDFLMNLLYEVFFGHDHSNILQYSDIKAKKFNTNEEVNNLLTVIFAVIQIIGKIMLIYNIFKLSAILRGRSKDDEVGSTVLGIIASIILYNAYEFIMLLKNFGGVASGMIDAIFNV